MAQEYDLLRSHNPPVGRTLDSAETLVVNKATYIMNEKFIIIIFKLHQMLSSNKQGGLSMKNRLFITCLFYMILTGPAYSQIDTITLDLEKNNFNTDSLSELHSEINDNSYGEVHSLLIVRNGDLVFEKYYNAYSRNQFHELYSVSKTFTSALIGIAIDQGKIKSVDENMLDFFPEYIPIRNNNSLKKAITLKHLLTMTSGFDNEGGSSRTCYSYTEYMLNRPVSDVPGSVWYYSNENAMIISAIIENNTGESAEDFANSYLFKPLGISKWYWSKVEDRLAPDLTNTAGGLQLRPLDMALFGQLYLQNGLWNGIQIIPKEWIDESVNVHVEFSKDDRSYGYQLWQFLESSSVSQMLRKNDVFFASGAKNQKNICNSSFRMHCSNN